ncbi:fungal-specific transcription factor domain-domain-containing protein [Microdochium bolleyi]|uniref:Fungal-specific transcription factor domain-domain-containing protein n=1 Tax=Microdochium bolleyi TaxID=196109 RepID=A0A136IL86_9PEZI|nr:fungal-specific transcription factor domain-domain-containing protein [Microdochium bolleyi]
MPKKQRVKGCFQCSVRRIDCDLGQPECAKCRRKGIECSGLARIRFAPGLASRGKLKNSSVPIIGSSSSSNSISRVQAATTQADEVDHDVELVPRTTAPIMTGEYELTPFEDAATFINEVMNVGRRQQASVTLQPWIPPVPHQARGLYSHFSQAVAPAMVVIDGLGNGYRNIILSMACNDDLLGKAVGVVAAQHLGLSQPEAREAARQGRTAVIEKLRRDATVAGPNAAQLVFTPSTWATLLILLVGETVTGGSEFEHLFRMLVAAAQNCDLSNVPPLLRDFLLKQTHMFEIIARPQLSTREGIDIISRSLDSHLDWVTSEIRGCETEGSRALAITEQAFREASELYLSRATTGHQQEQQQPSGHSSNTGPVATSAPAASDSVARLRALVSSLDPAAEGAHALVWPCFVAAAESTELGDRQFFTRRLGQIYAVTKFENVQMAAASLPLIWAMQDSAVKAGVGSSSWITMLGSILIM